VTRPFPWAGFLVLAFVIVLAVTTETMPTGLLPDMSRSLGVSEPAIGLLVTIYAFSVAVVSIPLIALTRRWQRHRLLAISVAVLGLSSVLSSLAPSYEAVVATRVFGGLGHAVFWATVGAYPGHAVAREQISKAVGIVLGGSTVGFVLGVPIATFVGHAFGWRPTFGAVGVILVLCAILVWRFLPAVTPVVRAPRMERRPDATVLPVLLVCALALVAMTGHYTFYTYIAPYAIGILGVPPGLVGPLLFLTGIAASLGLVLAGTVFAVRTSRGMMVALVASAIAVSCVAMSTHEIWLCLPALFIWSVALGMLPALMQTRILHVSSAAFRDAGNAVYTAAFNVGIGGGAFVGALVYGANGLTPLPWVDVAILVLSCVFVVATRRWDAPADPVPARARAWRPLRSRQPG
jgi:DHA1 family inner membrane transport protein